MDKEQLRVDHNRNEQGPRAGAMETETETGAPGLGDVAKDAIDHLKLIANDSLELGKLEARRVVLKLEENVKEIAPRIAVGAAAVTLGFAGVVLALVALFMALEDVIPSVPVRLVIFAAVFLALSVAGGFFAVRPLMSRGERPHGARGLPESAAVNKATQLAPTRPIGSIGE